MDPVTLMTGVGRLYVAPVGEAFPDVDTTPAGNWYDCGDTQDGVTVTLDQSIEEITVDQETGPVEAVRTEESLTIETKLPVATVEMLAKILGNSLTDTPAAAGTPGFRKVGMYKGATVGKYAFMFRGNKSPYGTDYLSQYEVPRGYFGGSLELEHTKDGNVAFSVEFHALVDATANPAAEKFGRFVSQDAAAV